MANDKTLNQSSVRATNHSQIKSYTALRGIDMTESDKSCFAYLENMFVDYEGHANGVESLPGYRKIADIQKNLHSAAIYRTGNKKFILIHAGKQIYAIRTDEREMTSLCPMIELEDADSRIFTFGSDALILCGGRIYHMGERGFTQIETDLPIARCTALTLFDDRIFLASDPTDPSLIYYSEPIDSGEIKFKKENIIGPHHTMAPVTELLAYGDSLWVFRATDRPENSILLLKRVGDSYSISASISAPPCLSGALALGNRVFYMSALGLMSIEMSEGIAYPRVKCVSCEISPLISKEQPEKAQLSTWLGYLVVAFGQQIYLADPRCERGLKWYFLSSIGGHRDDERIYRYHNEPIADCTLHPTPHAIAKGEIISKIDEGGRMIIYSLEGDKKYRVYPSPLMRGGEFLPARIILTDGRLMWFVTENGSLYLFNNDMSHLKHSPSLNDKELYYSFDNHAPTYMAITQSDDMSLPTKEKCLVGDSMVLCMKDYGDYDLTLSLIADGCLRTSHTLKGNVRRQDNDLKKTDPPIDPSMILKPTERLGGWQNLQLMFTNNDFCLPFGIKSISFGYRQK